MDDYIAYYAPHFPCYDRIRSIVLEEGVTEIGNGAFRDLKYVQEVTLPQSLKRISAGAFAGCEELQEISLPMQLTHIGSGAFSGSSLRQIFIPKNVLGIEGATFSECGQLEKIEVDPENQYFVSDHGIVYDRDKTRLVIVPKKSSLSKLVIPDTVREMDKKAIDHCGALKYIIFEGGSPSRFNSESQKLDYVTIFYDSSKEGWDPWDVVKTSWPDGNVFWRDTLHLKGEQSLASHAAGRPAGSLSGVGIYMEQFRPGGSSGIEYRVCECSGTREYGNQGRKRRWTVFGEHFHYRHRGGFFSPVP